MPSIIVDGGGLLFAQAALATTEKKALQQAAKGIIQAAAAMGTQAVGISPYDLGAGVDFLLQQQKENNLPFLSMNMYAKEGDRPIFTPYLLTKAGQIRIAILGFTGQLPTILQNQGYATRSWQETLPALMKEIEGKADLVILLSSGAKKINNEIARTFRNIHIIIQAGRHSTNTSPVNSNNTLLCQTAGQGKYLGVLTIDWKKSATWGDNKQNQLQKEQNRLDRINWQIGRTLKRQSKEELATNSRYQRLLQNKAQTEQVIARISKQQENAGQQPCSFSNQFIALKTSLPEDKTIKSIVDRTRATVNQMRRKAQQIRTTEQKVRLTTSPDHFQEYAGWKSCQECHPKQVHFYQQTGHSKAWQTLVDKEQQYNPDCLICHVTLPTYKKRQVEKERLLEEIPAYLQGVGCETCHGPAKKHIQEPEAVHLGKSNPAICLQCHSAERDDHFVYTEKLKKIRCPAGR